MYAATPTLITDAPAARGVFASLQHQAIELKLQLRQCPPEPTTCCGRGCNGCVWEGFLAAAAYWQEDALREIDAARAERAEVAGL